MPINVIIVLSIIGLTILSLISSYITSKTKLESTVKLTQKDILKNALIILLSIPGFFLFDCSMFITYGAIAFTLFQTITLDKNEDVKEDVWANIALIAIFSINLIYLSI